MMEIGKLLNADLSTIGAILARGIHWWAEEMRQMVPRRWHGRNGGSGKPLLLMEGREFRAAKGGLPRPGMILCLPGEEGLTRVLLLPPLPLPDLRRLVALDLDRLSPFAPDQVVFDILPGPRRGGALPVLVGIVPRSTARTAVERARTAGLPPAALALADDGGQACFDFLPMLEQAPPALLTPNRLRLAVAALAAINLAIFTARDMLATEQLRQQVDAMQPGIQAAVRLRAAVEAEAARRAEMLRRKRHQAPLPVLDALAHALPDTVWVQRLEWDGTRLRVTGWARDGADAATLLAAIPGLSDIQAAAPAMAADPARGQQFDLTAEMAP